MTGYVRENHLRTCTITLIVCRDGFEDPESGISHYLWSITTSNPAYNAGLPAAKRLPSSASADCTRLSPALPHNVTVYSTITAVHDAVEQLNATKTSDGGEIPR